MKTQNIIAFSATLLLSSCGIYSSYQPQTSVPENLYGEEVAVSDTNSIGNINWRDFFTDPCLQELIEKGLQQNTDVQTAGLRVEETKASLLSAKLAFLPSFALSPQGGLNTAESQVSRTYTLPVTASWEIDIFGKLRNSKRQAKAAYAQSEDYKQAVYSSLVANIANTYYTLLMLDEQLEISRTTAETWKETVESTQALMEAGQADEAAVSQMKATYFEVKNSVIDLEEQINLNGIILNVIDTAGIRETDDVVEKIGVDRAKKYLNEADLAIYVVDTSTQLDENDFEIMELLKDRKAIVLLNKSDLTPVTDSESIRKHLDKKMIAISAKEQTGIEELEETIRKMFFTGEVTFNDEVYITNIRHKTALQEARNSLNLVVQSILDGMPEDFYSIDLMNAYEELGSIVGEAVEDDLVNEIFSKFCMGK